jgi:hypothetical protein
MSTPYPGLLSLSGFSIFGEIELNMCRLPASINVGIQWIYGDRLVIFRRASGDRLANGQVDPQVDPDVIHHQEQQSLGFS